MFTNNEKFALLTANKIAADRFTLVELEVKFWALLLTSYIIPVGDDAPPGAVGYFLLFIWLLCIGMAAIVGYSRYQLVKKAAAFEKQFLETLEP